MSKHEQAVALLALMPRCWIEAGLATAREHLQSLIDDLDTHEPVNRLNALELVELLHEASDTRLSLDVLKIDEPEQAEPQKPSDLIDYSLGDPCAFCRAYARIKARPAWSANYGDLWVESCRDCGWWARLRNGSSLKGGAGFAAAIAARAEEAKGSGGTSRACTRCKGTGWEAGDERCNLCTCKRCKRCKGRGRVTVDNGDAEDCPECAGSGKAVIGGGP